ncbi:hypothetical protein ABT023_24185 [Micromonospora sp. NPDC002296]|uniref:hypothetical protein n=1 Tax=Micromonospora sp. NPDC002296 TaxID=3154271 RepID=UPI003333E587
MGRTLRVGIPILLLAAVGWCASYATTVLVWEVRKLVPWLVAPALVALLAGAPFLVRLLTTGSAAAGPRPRRPAGSWSSAGWAPPSGWRWGRSGWPTASTSRTGRT